MIKRVSFWEVAMMDAIARHADQPFAWGVSDCFELACDAVHLMTAKDPFPTIRGAYDSEHDALRILARRKAKSVIDLFARKFEEIPPAHAQRGDLAAWDEMGIGIVTGRHVVGKGPAGMTTLPATRMTRAVRIG